MSHIKSLFVFILLAASLLEAEAAVVQRYRMPSGRYPLHSGSQKVPAYCVDGHSRPAAEATNQLSNASSALHVLRTYNGRSESLSVPDAVQQGVMEVRGNGSGDSLDVLLKISPREGETIEFVADDSGYAVLGETAEDIASISRELRFESETLRSLGRFERASNSLKKILGDGRSNPIDLQEGAADGASLVLRRLEHEVQVGLKHRSSTAARDLAEDAYARLHEEVLRGYSPSRRLENLTWQLGRQLTLKEIAELKNSGLDIADEYSPLFDSNWKELDEAISMYEGIFDVRGMRSLISGARWRENFAELIPLELSEYATDEGSTISQSALELRFGRTLAQPELTFLEKYGNFKVVKHQQPIIDNAVFIRWGRDGLVANTRTSSQRISFDEITAGKISMNLRGKTVLMEESFLDGDLTNLDPPEVGRIISVLHQSGALTYRSFGTAAKITSEKPIQLIVLAPTEEAATSEAWQALWGEQNAGVLTKALKGLRNRKDCDFIDSAEAFEASVKSARDAGKQVWIFRHNLDSAENLERPVERLLNALDTEKDLRPDDTTDIRCSSFADLTGESFGTLRDIDVEAAAKAFSEVLEKQGSPGNRWNIGVNPKIVLPLGGRQPGPLDPHGLWNTAYFRHEEGDGGGKTVLIILGGIGVAITYDLISVDDDDDKPVKEPANQAPSPNK